MRNLPQGWLLYKDFGKAQTFISSLNSKVSNVRSLKALVNDPELRREFDHHFLWISLSAFLLEALESDELTMEDKLGVLGSVRSKLEGDLLARFEEIFSHSSDSNRLETLLPREAKLFRHALYWPTVILSQGRWYLFRSKPGPWSPNPIFWSLDSLSFRSYGRFSVFRDSFHVAIFTSAPGWVGSKKKWGICIAKIGLFLTRISSDLVQRFLS